MAKRFSGDSGSIAIEFLVLGLVAQLAIVGFGLQMLQVQRAELASQSLARQVARLLASNAAADNLGAVKDQVAASWGVASGQADYSVSPAEPQPGNWFVVSATVQGQTQQAVMRVAN